jgi:SAM-dependent methyltransferase
MSEPARDWAGFWDQPHSIYVNERHLDAHYRDVATGIVKLLPGPAARVLDYGCGEAIHAALVADAASEVLLCESAATVRESLQKRFANNRKIRVLAPEDLARHPNGSIDLVIANSVVQYLSRAELDRLLAEWRRLLAPGGALIVADVIPPDVGPSSDALALLRYAARNGFFSGAVLGVIRTAFSPYRRMRARLGIACYAEAEFLAMLAARGYAAERLSFNLEHNPARMTFRARPV